MNRYETVWRSIQMSLDDTGHGAATRHSLALLSGVSQNTVSRAIRAFVADGLIACESKQGHSGGYLFGPPNRSQTAHQTAQTAHQTAQKFETGNAFSQTDQAPSGTGLVGLRSQTAHQTAQTAHDVAESAQWFVCCVWYDEKGEMWCHGADGYDTYIPCASKEAAMEEAEKHARMFHKDKRQRYGVLPRVDVCETYGNGKSLFYSYNSLGGPDT